MLRAVVLLLAVVASAAAPPPDEGTSLTRRDPTAPTPRPEEARGWQEDPGIEGVDVVLFVPRVVLGVPRLVLATVFWPIHAGIEASERHAVPEHIKDVLYNDERNAAIVPAVSYQSDFGFSYGANAFHDDVLGHGEEADLKVRFGGVFAQAYQASFEADRLNGSRYWLETRARFEVNPSLLFQGIGSSEAGQGGEDLIGPRDASVETRFSQHRMLALLRGGYVLGNPGALIKTGGTVIFNRRRFDRERGDGEELSIDEIYDTAQIAGFDDGFDLLELNGNLIVDARNCAGQTSSGVYFELFGGGAPKRLEKDHHFWHYGGEATAYIDLYRHDRVLVMRAAIEAVHGDDGEIPFTELPRLGGPHRLRGYGLDRFRDRRSAMGTVEYHYPVHGLVAGELFFDVGQVARDYDALFADVGDWRTGVGGGVIISTIEDLKLRFEIAYGDGVEVYFTTDPLQAFVSRSKQL